jgi:hypothetical protein
MRTMFVALAIAAAIFAGCAGDDDTTGPTTPTSTATDRESASASAAPTGSPTDCTVLGTATGGDLTWDQLLPAGLPDLGQYGVEHAEGDAPLINVLQEGEVAGTVELLQFPVTGNVDVTRPNIEALKDWAERFYDDVAPEREAAGGILTGDEPADARIGEACGVSYGYTVVDESETVIERYAGYVTHDGDRMFLFVALYDAAISEELGFGTVEALEGFEPEFAKLMESLAFPPG